MNQKIEFSQFIYGKFPGKNSGYRLVAYTIDLAAREQQLTDMAERTYYFWGAQGTEGDKKAVGILPHGKDELLLLQAAPAVDGQEQMLSSGGSRFDQHRYIFVPRKLLVNLNNQTFLPLIRLFNMPIPYFSDLNVPALPQANNDILWWDLVADLFAPPSSEELNQAKELQIQECWGETDNQGQSLFLSALALLLNKKRILLTLDRNAKDPGVFLDSLLMLLPASCRSEIAIAAGAVDEHRCNWADLIVKTNGRPKQPLPNHLTWLERDKKIIIGEHSQKIFDHQYVSEFIAPIDNQPDKILKLVKHLNTIIDETFNIENLTDPDSLVRVIPGLPEEQQVELWCKYIPKVTIDWESVIEDLREYQSFWQALKQLVDRQLKYMQLMLMVIEKLSEAEVIQILETDLLRNLRLATDLLNIGLLNQFQNKPVDTDIAKILIEICYQAVEHRSGQDTVEAWKLANTCINYEKLFPFEDKQFRILDAALKGELDVETLKVRFNQKLAVKLPYLNREEILNSNLYRHLQEKVPHVAQSIERLFEQQEKGLVELPTIADAMQMKPDRAGILYSKFLERYTASSVGLEDVRPIIIYVIEKSIIDKPQNLIRAKFEHRGTTQQLINLRFDPTLFPNSYQRFESIDSDLVKVFGSLEKLPSSWENWKILASTLYKTSSLERISFLERTVLRFFTTEVLAYWLEIIRENIIFEKSFLESSTWSYLQPKDIKNILIDRPDRAKQIAYLAIKQERFELISKDLLHYLKQFWLTNKLASEDDQKLWKALTSPSTLNYFNNINWLNLWYLNWLFGQEVSFPPPKTALNETEKQYFYKLAIELFNQTTQFKHKQRLLNDCCIYGLDVDKAKQIAIKLIKICSTPEQVCSLMADLKSYNFTFSEQREVLKSVDANVCDLNLLLKYLNSTSQEVADNHEIDLIKLLFSIPISSDEDNRKRKDFLDNYPRHISQNPLALLIISKLNYAVSELLITQIKNEEKNNFSE